MSDHPRKPISALRRIEADQTLLRIEVRSLCQQVARFDEDLRQYRRDLEALAQLFRQEFKQREEHRRERNNSK